MHCPRIYWHPAPYLPWYAYGGHWGQGWHGHHGGHGFPVAVAVPYVPWPAAAWPQTQIREVEADAASSPQEGLVGGQAEVHLTLEYFVADGAAAPEVQVVIEAAGATTTWQETGIAAGYHTKNDFGAVAPGAKVTLTAVDATARLRWCESICC